MLADEVGRQALHCIRCSACLNVCPVYSRTGGHAYGSVYPGPIGAILTPQLSGIERAGSLPFASSLCGACYEVCPVQDRHPARAPAPARESGRGDVGGRGERLRCGRSAGRSQAGGGSSSPSGSAGSRSGRSCAGTIERLPGPLAGWTSTQDLPPLARQSFRDWWRESAGERGA